MEPGSSGAICFEKYHFLNLNLNMEYDTWTRVRDAITSGDDESMYRALGSDVRCDGDSPSSEDMTLMAHAARCGNLAALNLLTDRGASVDVRSRESRCTPLRYACMRTDMGAILWLIANGADVHAADSGGGLPIHYAAGAVNIEAVRLFMRLGVDIKARRNANCTVLHDLMRSQRNSAIFECVRELCAAGADQYALDAHGHTPFHCALNR